MFVLFCCCCVFTFCSHVKKFFNLFFAMLIHSVYTEHTAKIVNDYKGIKITDLASLGHLNCCNEFVVRPVSWNASVLFCYIKGNNIFH